MISFSFLLFFTYACGLDKKSVVFLLENGFFLDNATLEQLAPVYRLVRDRLTEACDDCFANAYDLKERLECNTPCAIREPVTLEQLAQVFKDVNERFRQECTECYVGRDWSESQFFCAPCEALAIPPAGSYEWTLSMKIWLNQLPLETKKEMAEELARELFTADNAFFRANEERCVESMVYCSRTYQSAVINYDEDYDYQTQALKARIAELEGMLDEREYAVQLLSRLRNECKAQLETAENALEQTILEFEGANEILDRVILKI